MAGASEPPPHCSFCGLAAPDVAKLITGPGVYICDECVTKCNQILTRDTGSAAGQLPEWDTMTNQEILGRLPRIAAASAQADEGLRRRIAELHNRGVSWAQVGAALGITRQSAWERFADRSPTRDAETQPRDAEASWPAKE
jgi:hypothetical protein